MSINTPARIYRHDFDHSEPDTSPLMLATDSPPWRMFAPKPVGVAVGTPAKREMDPDQAKRGRDYIADEEEAKLVNAALVLRRPLLITGPAGVGKSTLAYSVAWQLGLGNVLRWNITSRSTLKEALYQYDAIARLHDESLPKEEKAEIKLTFGDYFTLGPLGTALLPTKAQGYFPRVLLIDEIDKSDADLPSDLLHVLEEGSFNIPEVARLPSAQKSKVVSANSTDTGLKVDIPSDGRIRCDDFPLILMTSNAERDFPAPFLRRCLQLAIPWERRAAQLAGIIRKHLGVSPVDDPQVADLLKQFNAELAKPDAALAIDQLLNAIFLVRSRADVNPLDHLAIKEAVFRSLNESPQGTPL